MSVGGEVCFELLQPVIGRSAGRVCLTPFGEIRVEHRLLKAPVVFSTARVRSVIAGTPSHDDDLPTLVRDPVAVHLPRDAFTAANVGFVFVSPVRVGPFRYGAQQLIPLSSSHRRHGLDVDLLALTVAEPTQLLEGLASLGLAPSADLGRTLGTVIPAIPPELEAQVLEDRRRRVRRASYKTVGVGVVMAGLLGAAAGGQLTWETVVRTTLASAAVATLLGLALSLRRGRVDPAPSAFRWASRGVAGLAFLVGLGSAIGASPHLVGGTYLLTWSLLAGAAGSIVIAGGLRGLARTAPTPVPGDPLARPPRRRWPAAALVALGAVAVIVGAVASEESAAQIVRDVKAALIDEEDVPGWTTCCDSDEILRGDTLDQHICGGDDDALPAHRAAVRRSFNKLVPGHPDRSLAHFDLTVLLAPSIAAAESEFAAVDSPTYFSCTATSIGERASQFQSGATDLANAVYEGREQIGGLPDLVIDRFYIRVPVSGTVDVKTGYFVRGRVGRAIVRMPMLVYVPFALDQSERDAMIRAVIDEVEAAQL